MIAKATPDLVFLMRGPLIPLLLWAGDGRDCRVGCRPCGRQSYPKELRRWAQDLKMAKQHRQKILGLGPPALGREGCGVALGIQKEQSGNPAVSDGAVCS